MLPTLSRKRKAFIAAPLLGTIIFLASILFIVNLSKAEAGETALVVSDAYHNRIVSLLEVYRTDLGSLFRENLGRVIEEFLSRECWDNLFKISNYEEGGPISVKQARKQACEHVTQVIHQVICSYAGKCDHDDDNKTPLVDCAMYGLPAWMQRISKNVSFEGITFSASNPDQFEVFMKSEDPGYVDNCSKLLQGSIFDCDAFAEGELACKDTFFDDDPENDEVIEGCEKGTFYVKVRIEDWEIYPRMPRIFSDDKTGNQIRSGAISDSDFYLPINYPLFKYYNYSFGAFEYLAYGVSGKTGKEHDDEKEKEGVADGFCAEQPKGDCNQVSEYGDDGFKQTGQEAIDKLARNAFFDGAYTEACQEFTSVRFGPKEFPATGGGLSPGEDLALEVCTESGSCASLMGEEGKGKWKGWKNCTETENGDQEEGGSFSPTEFSIASKNCDPADGDAKCAFIKEYGSIASKMRFVDYDPTLQVNPDAPNQFCWKAVPQHEA